MEKGVAARRTFSSSAPQIIGRACIVLLEAVPRQAFPVLEDHRFQPWRTLINSRTLSNYGLRYGRLYPDVVRGIEILASTVSTRQFSCSKRLCKSVLVASSTSQISGRRRREHASRVDRNSKNCSWHPSTVRIINTARPRSPLCRRRRYVQEPSESRAGQGISSKSSCPPPRPSSTVVCAARRPGRSSWRRGCGSRLARRC